MSDKITVVIKEPGKEPRQEQLENSLESLQKAVGGYIQVVPYHVAGTVLICNEEGKIEGLPLNFWLNSLDYIAGTAVICADQDEDFVSLDEMQAARVMRLLKEGI